MGALAAVAAVAAAVRLAIAPTPARADGDPASDVLIAGRVFVGFGSATSTPEVRELLELTAEARRKGLPIRVAFIREVPGLGAVPTLFGHAQRYATFLRQELRFVYHGTLVIVMGGTPGGIGVFGPGATPAAKAAVQGIAVPIAGDAGKVAVIASTAIRRVAAADGHALTTPRAPRAKASSHVLAVATGGARRGIAVSFAAGLLILRRRPQSSRARHAARPPRQWGSSGASARSLRNTEYAGRGAGRPNSAVLIRRT